MQKRPVALRIVCRTPHLTPEEEREALERAEEALRKIVVLLARVAARQWVAEEQAKQSGQPRSPETSQKRGSSIQRHARRSRAEDP